MNYRKSTIALGVIAAIGLTACGGSDDDDNPVATNNTNQQTDPCEATGSGSGPFSDKVTCLNDRGSWGSIVLSGYGNINIADGADNNQALTEASPGDVDRYYGGTSNGDSSGSIEYAVVAETGTAFRQDEEVQGITVEAAGSGTRIDHVQILNSDDDGIEWFGGAADLSNAVIQAATDDSLDQDQGWQGTVKTALVIQGPDSGNRGMETDNNGDTLNAMPKTSPVLANVTILGHSGNSGDQSAGALHREGYGGQVYRSVYTDNTVNVAGGSGAFQQACLDLDDEVDGNLKYGDVLFNCDAGSLASDGDGLQTQFKNSGSYGVTPDGDLTIDNQTLAINTDESASSATGDPKSTPNGNQVTANGWHGAVDPSANAPDTTPNNGGPFWDGWTYKNSALSTNLPGNTQNFHPLRKEIENATIDPASTANCPAGNAAGSKTDVFGMQFPVCVINDGDLDGDITLTNDHVYVLAETVQVGNGDVESAANGNAADSYTLTVEKGTQIFGDDDAQSSLVITRGSEIDVNGTADQPVIFGAASYEG